MSMLIPVLTAYEKEHIAERQPLPERYLGAVGRGNGRAHPRGQADARPPSRHSRSPLSARRSDQVRRLHRRLVQARQSGQPASRRRIHRLLRRALHGRERRRAERRPSAGDSARPRRRLFDGRHGGPRAARTVLERPRADARRRRRHRARHLHQLGGVDQSVLRRARRRRLHLVECRGHVEVGLGTRRADSVPAGSASRPQHRLQDGRAARPDGRVGSRTRSGAASSRKPSRTRASFSGRATARFTRASPCGRSRTSARSIPASASSSTRKCRCDVVQAADDSGSTEYIIRHGEPTVRPDRCGRSAPKSISSIAWRGRCSPTARCCRSISSAASARRCSASRRTICLWTLEGLVDGDVHNRIVVPDDQKHWTKVALDRMLSIRSGCDASVRLRHTCHRGSILRFYPLRRTSDGSIASAASVSRPTRSNRTSTSRRWRSITASITTRTSPT